MWKKIEQLGDKVEAACDRAMAPIEKRLDPAMRSVSRRMPSYESEAARAFDPEADKLWQDRQIRFDVLPSAWKLRRGEFEIDSINSVEDTKGNNGERGFLIVTNLRLLWASHKDTRTNLSIGYSCLTSTNIKRVHSKLRGNVSALHLLTKFKNSRFEFIFTSLVKASPRLFTTALAIVRAYRTTSLYRDLKLRGAIIKESQLLLLPDEQPVAILCGGTLLLQIERRRIAHSYGLWILIPAAECSAIS